MAYPSTKDTTVTLPVESASTPLSTNHVANHTASQIALIALETKVGIDGDTNNASHDFKLSEVISTDKAVGKTATQTLTNKTLTSPTITGSTITTSSVNGVTLQTGGSATDFLAANGTYQAGGVANASTIVKGIVEAATSAEVTAGTATGGTGAVLVVTPDALASSTPVFNGSGLTGISTGFIGSSGTDVSVTSTTTETTLATIAIPANTLGTTKAIRLKMYILAARTSLDANVTLRIKYGGSTIASFVYDPNTAASETAGIIIDGDIFGKGTTSSQIGQFSAVQNGFTNTATNFQYTSIGTSAVDSTVSQNLIITAQHESASSQQTTTLKSYIVSKIV